MKSKYILTPLLIILLLAFSNETKAQLRSQYFLTTTPQAIEMNPAIQPYSKGFAFLPGLSSVQFNVSNNALSVRDIFATHPTQPDSIIIDYDNISSTLKDKNSLNSDVSTNIMGFGFRVKELYFSFQASVHSSNTFKFPSTIVDFTYGNGNFMGEDNPLSFEGFGGSSISYGQIALGISRNITDSITVGLRLKYLKGLAAANFEKFDAKLYTDAETYIINVKTDLLLRLSGPVTIPEKEDEDNPGTTIVDTENIEVDELGDISEIFDTFLFNSNSGFAIDLGGVYKLNEKITLSASVVDLGYISWKTNTNSLTNLNDSFEYDGVDVSDEIDMNKETDPNEDENSIFDDIADDFFALAKLKNSNESFTTWLPTKLYIGGTYNVLEKVNLGVLSYTRFAAGNTQSSLSLSTNVSPTNWFSAGISYSIANRAYNNLGFGFALRGGPFQFYAATDYLNTAFRWQRAKAVNFNFGLNLVFGNKKKVSHSLIDEI